MSTAATANSAATARLLTKKQEEKKMESDGEVNKKSDHDNKLEDSQDYNGDDVDSEVLEDDSPVKSDPDLSLGPQLSIQEQLDLDKDDASLRKWKEQLLGSIDVSIVGAMSKEPEVQVLNLTVKSPGRPDNVIPTPFRSSSAKANLFTLKEGCKQQIKFEFVVSKNIVCGLKYLGDVWKKGIKVDHSKKMVGTFSPREEPYKFELEEETTPSGIFARGSYSARTRFVDDDGKCHFDATYYFGIQKNWE